MNFDNDADIVAHTTKHGTILYMNGKHFACGQMLECNFGEEVRAPQLQQWCQMVRQENERQIEKANRERSKAAASQAPDGRGDTDASNGGGGAVAVAEVREDLEEELQARKEALVRRIEELNMDINHAHAEQERAIRSLEAIDAALDVYNGS